MKFDVKQIEQHWLCYVQRNVRAMIGYNEFIIKETKNSQVHYWVI